MLLCRSGMTRSDGELLAGAQRESNTVSGWEDETLIALDPTSSRLMFPFLSQLDVQVGHSAASSD